MFVGEDSTEGVKSSLLLGLLVCLLCVCFFFLGHVHQTSSFSLGQWKAHLCMLFW